MRHQANSSACSCMNKKSWNQWNPNNLINVCYPIPYRNRLRFDCVDNGSDKNVPALLIKIEVI